MNIFIGYRFIKDFKAFEFDKNLEIPNMLQCGQNGLVIPLHGAAYMNAIFVFYAFIGWAISDNIRALKDFLKWLERQNGYRTKIDYNHIDYLNISNNQRKEAKAKEYKKSHEFEQIIETIRKMPDQTITERRNKAIVSMGPKNVLR